MSAIKRCAWAPEHLPLYLEYHDTEWGVPSRDERHLFEMLLLEGAQAGLSWWTVLKKRERYREQFHQFDPVRVAQMTDKDLDERMQDTGIIRHRGKLEAFRDNGHAWLELQETEGCAVNWLWDFVGGKPIQNRWKTLTDLPAKTELSDRLSKELKKRGFRFVGSTTVYAFMQACGMVNDHVTGCFRHEEIRRLGG